AISDDRQRDELAPERERIARPRSERPTIAHPYARARARRLGHRQATKMSSESGPCCIRNPLRGSAGIVTSVPVRRKGRFPAGVHAARWYKQQQKESQIDG